MTEATSQSETYLSPLACVRKILLDAGEPVSKYEHAVGRHGGMTQGYILATHATDPQTVLVTWTNGVGNKPAPKDLERSNADHARELVEDNDFFTAPSLIKDDQQRWTLVVNVPPALAHAGLATAYTRAYTYRHEYDRHYAQVADEIDQVAKTAEGWARDTRRAAERLRNAKREGVDSAREAVRSVGEVQSLYVWGIANAGLHHMTTRVGDLYAEQVEAERYEAEFEELKKRLGIQ